MENRLQQLFLKKLLHAHVHIHLIRRIKCIQMIMFTTLNCLCVNRPYSYCWIDSIIGFTWISLNVFEAWMLDTVSTYGQCFSTWANRLCDCLKLLPHERQWCSFSPVCNLSGFTRFPDSAKPFPQCEHFKCFSLACAAARIWLSWRNFHIQSKHETSHRYVFSGAVYNSQEIENSSHEQSTNKAARLNASSGSSQKWLQNIFFDHTHQSQMAFLWRETVGEIWGIVPVWNLNHTNGMRKASYLCEFLCDASDVLVVWSSSHIEHMWTASLQCELLCDYQDVLWLGNTFHSESMCKDSL